MSQHVRAERVSDVLQQRAQLLATMSTYKCDKARMLALSALPAAAQGLLVPYRTLARSTALTSDARFAQRLAVSYLLLILFFNLSRRTQFLSHESQGRADQSYAYNSWPSMRPAPPARTAYRVNCVACAEPHCIQKPARRRQGSRSGRK